MQTLCCFCPVHSSSLLSDSSLELALSWDPVSYYHGQMKMARNSLVVPHGGEQILFVTDNALNKIKEEFSFEDSPCCKLNCE